MTAGGGRGAVAITGIGVLSPVGAHPGAFWPSLLEGRSGIRPITRFDASDLPCKVAGSVEDFDPAAHFDRRDLLTLDRSTQLATAAALTAAKDAGLGPDDLAPAAVIVGSGFCTVESYHDTSAAFIERGPRGVKTMTIPKGMPNAIAAIPSMRLGARGPHYVVAAACSSGTMAIAHAMRLVRHGVVPLALAGGTEAALIKPVLSAWCALRVAAKADGDPAQASRPFSADRDGLVLGEGAAVLVLEDPARARARGARIYALLRGAGESSDASHLTAPSTEGEALAMRRALEDAGVAPGDIDHVNAHGTATPLNDRVETLALKLVFGERARALTISATKSMIGHAIGAGGAIETAATALALRDQVVHPTINLRVPDPECDLDYVSTGARRGPLRLALKESFAFGGANAALVLERAE